MPEIQNPNQQGGPDSRMLLFYAVMFLAIFLGLQYFRGKDEPHTQNAQKHAPAAASQQAAQTTAGPSSTASAGNAAPGATAKSGKPAPAAAATPAIEAASETTTVVESPLYRVTFSNKGGVVTSWVLKKYTNDAQTKPLDLVNQAAAKQFGYPLSLYTYDKQLTPQLNSVLYKPSATGTLQAPATVSFVYSVGGLTVRKSFHFENSYVLKTDVTVTENGKPVTALLAWPAGFGDQETLPQYASAQIDMETGAKTGFHILGGPDVQQIAPKKVSGGNTIQGPLDYAGVSDLYFASIFLPQNPANALMVTLHNAMDLPESGAKPDSKAKKTQVSVLGAAVGSTTGEIHDRLFVGPKASDILKSISTADHYNLEGVVNYSSWWGWIAKPMFLLLQFFHDHGIRNWGWAILLMTVIFYSLMWPTRLTMMKKSLAMMRIQPQMDAIKAKYAKYKATDPRKQEMNQEMMELQKREGINMFSGCLPMLLQYPLLIGFYEMLEGTIALRHAHWLWLPDLSAPDPYHILPIFVILSMFLVQFFTPSPGVDPKQQRMMAFMLPAFFGFMMWNIGSGVALYWAGGNVIGVAQQFIMNKSKMGQEMRELAAKRAAKKAAKGKR
ncbi:MAG: membrane protein insertase YidC [Acidobacteriaceae bacterium]